MKSSPFQIVLVEPEIPHNTGSIGRTCVGTGSPLHLVGKLGFSLEDRYLKRAGLDYWKDVMLHRHETWPDFLAWRAESRQSGRLVLFSKKASQSIFEFSFSPGDFLIFGKETQGLPEDWLKTDHPAVRIPTPGPVRSLNLAVAAGIALYEGLRQHQSLAEPFAGPQKNKH